MQPKNIIKNHKSLDFDTDNRSIYIALLNNINRIVVTIYYLNTIFQIERKINTASTCFHK